MTNLVYIKTKLTSVFLPSGVKLPCIVKFGRFTSVNSLRLPRHTNTFFFFGGGGIHKE